MEIYVKSGTDADS